MGNKFCGFFKNSNSETNMAAKKRSAEIVEAVTKHTSTLIFLHGLGDNGSGWALSLKHFVPKHCKIICPHAPVQPVTLNGGLQMSSWFDIVGLTPDSPQDIEGIKKGSENLLKLVNDEIENGVQANRIIIGGFSQGGALALYTGLTGHVHRYAGILAFSTWLPLHNEFKSNPSSVVIDRNTPVLQCHGQMDPLVPIQMGQMSKTFLSILGLKDVQFKTYPMMMHASSEEELKDMSEFLTKILGKE